ncbi:MAG TPA: lipid A biosynthesis acyltransferase [Burkholderiales bacterium]|nr:lipid A biosynthesis acyltransferase [Burkholderiales bacterium]
MSRVLIAFIWLIRFLPLGALAAIGNAFGALAFWLVPERRRVARINLEKCFPQLLEAERERIARAHFRWFCRSIVERGVWWWGSRERIRRLVRVEGEEHLAALQGKGAVLLAPHFVGLDAILRLAMQYPMVSTYSHQKDRALDEMIFKRRTRFGGGLFSRQETLRPAIRAIKSGSLYYYLPDMDFGRKGTVFVPFFGVQAATAMGLAYISRLARAPVLPCVTRMLPGGAGYVMRIYPPWTDFPSGDDAADARRMMAFIEERVLEMPEQYFWLHKRFKTRPEGEARFY